MSNSNQQTIKVKSSLSQFTNTFQMSDWQKYLESVLGEKRQSFVTTVTTLVNNTAQLQECQPQTIIYAALKSASFGFPVDNNLGFAYVLPYKNTKKGKDGNTYEVLEAQFQMGAKGIVQLAVRSGQFLTINVSDVREGELVSRDRLTGNIQFKWIDNEVDRGKAEVIGYVGYFKLKGGYEKIFYMSKEEVTQHSEKYSQAVKKGYSSPWKDNFDAMAKKTVLKLMLNKGDAPLSIELQDAIKYDQSVIYDENGTHAYVDSPSQQNATPIEVQDAEIVEDNAQSKGESQAPY